MELKIDPGTGEVAGYASLFGLPADAYGDVVTSGAFRESLATRLPAMLREHKGAPVGTWDEAIEDDLGLKVRGRVIDWATLTDLRAGRLDGLSIGFIARKVSDGENGTRVLEEIDLHEVSFGKHPVNSRARVLQVKSEDNEMDEVVETKDAPDEIAALTTKIDGLAGDFTKISARLDKVEIKANRPGATVENKAEGAKAFTSFLRRGAERMDPIEVKDLIVSNDTTGGYLAPDEFIRELMRNVVLFSPVRSVARVATIGSGAAILPKRTGRLTASWVGETTTRPETQPTFGQNRYEVKELACYVDVSVATLEDAAFDIGSELAFDFAEEFGRAEGAAFVDGAGALQPFGFMNDTNIAFTASGSATAITADGLIQLFHDLPTPYRGSATWGMNTSTLGVIRKLKDPGTGTYLLMTSGIANAPATTLLGRPVIELPDMPDIAGNAFPIVLGDFASGYRVFDRVALSVLRDPYSVATSGLVRFHARRRLAAGVAKSEAIRKLKIATS